MKKLWYIMIFYSHIESYEHLYRNHMTYRKGKCFLRHYIEVGEPCFIWFVIWNNKLSNLKELKSFLGFWYNFLHHIFVSFLQKYNVFWSYIEYMFNKIYLGIKIWRKIIIDKYICLVSQHCLIIFMLSSVDKWVAFMRPGSYKDLFPKKVFF